MLNKVTRKILGDLGAINQSMIITYPITVVKAGMSMQGYVDLSKLGEEEFTEFGIYNINSLNSVINVIDNAEVELDGKILLVKGSNSNISYTTTAVNIIESECRGDPGLIDRIKNNTVILSTSLEAKELDKIKKTSSLLDTKELSIKCSNEDVSFICQSKEKSSNKYEVKVKGECTDPVEVIITMEMINKIPNANYDIKMHKSVKGNIIVVLDDKDKPGLSIVVSAKSV